MNEELKELVSKAISLAEKTGEFAIEQAPELLQQFYKWSAVSNYVFIVFGITLMVVGRYVPLLWLKEYDEYDDIKFFGKSGDLEAFIAWLAFIGGGAAGLTMVVTSVYDLAFLYSAPKLYIIDYFL